MSAGQVPAATASTTSPAPTVSPARASVAGVTVSRRRRRLAHSARDRAIAATWSFSAICCSPRILVRVTVTNPVPPSITREG